MADIAVTVVIGGSISAAAQIIGVLNQAPPQPGTVNIYNTNSPPDLLDSVAVASGGSEDATVAATPITTKNTAGTTVAGPTSFPSGVAGQVTAPNATATPKNSAGTTIGSNASIPSGATGNAVADDISFTDSDNETGTPTAVAAGVNIIAKNARAVCYLRAAGVTDASLQNAVFDLVNDAIAAGLFHKLYALYLFLGGTATAHSYNLINLLQYAINFSGGWTHNSNGAQPNGTNGVAYTGFNPNFVVGAGTFGFGIYTDTPQASILAIEALMAINNTGNTEFAQLFRNNSPGSVGRIRSSNSASYVGSLGAGYFGVNRIANNDLRLTHQGNELATETTATAANLPDYEMVLAARQVSGGALNAFSNSNIQLVDFNMGFTPAEVVTWSGLVDNFIAATR